MKQFIPTGVLTGWLLVAMVIWPCQVAAKYQEVKTFLPDLPLIDSHSHVYRGEQDFEELLNFMDRNNVMLMVVSGLTWGADADDQVIQAQRQFPERFLPFLRGFDPTWDHANDYVQNRLLKENFNGIGELFINGHGRNLKGDHPSLIQVYQTAGEEQIPVLFHWTIGSTSEKEPGTKAGFQQMKRVLSENPQTRFILAHCGKGPPPCREGFGDILDYLLKQHKNLFLDISGLHDDLFDDEGKLSVFGSILLRLAVTYPDHLLLGFDLGDPGCLFSQADMKVKLYRKFLSLLPREAAEKIAHRNAESLFAPGQLRLLEKKRVKRPVLPTKPLDPLRPFYDTE